MATLGAGQGNRRDGQIADRFVIRAAGIAPSVQNTQPWRFTSSQGVLRLYADPGRGLPAEDPQGRELVISCGAALCNLVLAIRHLGFGADVRLLPDPARTSLLAEVRWGRFAPPTPYEEALYRAISRRHTHRGPFTAGIPPLLAGELVRVARKERADLNVVYGTGRQRELAALVRAAEQAQRASAPVADERARWARYPGDIRPDGVVGGDWPGQWDGPEFVGRGTGPQDGTELSFGPDDPHAVGLVALLSTREDSKPGWLLAGQALQRVLLYATQRGVAAAFHTQPLEIAGTRQRIREEFTGRACPQLLLRFGYGGRAVASPRRPVSDALRAEAEPAAGDGRHGSGPLG